MGLDAIQIVESFFIHDGSKQDYITIIVYFAQSKIMYKGREHPVPLDPLLSQRELKDYSYFIICFVIKSNFIQFFSKVVKAKEVRRES